MSENRKPEDYFHLLAENTEEYIKNLKAGYVSTDKELSVAAVNKRMWRYIKVNARNSIFWLKFSLPFLTGGTLWIPYYPFNVMTDEGKIIVLTIIGIVSICLLRNTTLNLMKQPSKKDFFHLGAYEKYNKDEYSAFSQLISDPHFSFKKLKDDLKSPSVLKDSSLDEHKSFINDLKETIKQKNAELYNINSEMKELKAEIKEHQKNSDYVRENIEELENAIRSIEKEKEIYTKIVKNSHNNLQMFVNRNFSEDVLNDLQFDYMYSIYELQSDKSFKFVTCKGVNAHELPSNIKHSDKQNTIITANRRKGKVVFRDAEIVKAIPISDEKVVAVQLHLTDEQIDILNDDLNSLHKIAKIDIEATFRLFWICLLIQHSVDELKTQLKGAGNE